VRVRGNASQLLEKYKVLARDAHQAGDRVATEYYLQHADHYFRVLNDSRIRQEEMRARRGPFDQLEEDGDDDAPGQDGADETMDRPERGFEREDRRPERQPDREQPGARRVRDGGRDAARPDNRQDGRQDGRQDNRQDAPRADAPDAEERPRRWQERPDRRPVRADVAPADGASQGAAALRAMSDGEAALVAFGGPLRDPPAAPPAPPAPEPVAISPDADAPPPPRKRGRPRKVEAAPAEG